MCGSGWTKWTNFSKINKISKMELVEEMENTPQLQLGTRVNVWLLMHVWWPIVKTCTGWPLVRDKTGTSQG